MSALGAKIIEGLKEAAAGKFTRVTIEGETWERIDRTEKRVRCFMDGIDWQHHLDGDVGGTSLYPDEAACHAGNPCMKEGGCGMVEVETRLIRWVEPQYLKFHE